MNIPNSQFIGTAGICGMLPNGMNTNKEEKVQFWNRWDLSATLEMWLMSVCLSFSGFSEFLCSRSYFDLLSRNFHQRSDLCYQGNLFQNTLQQWFIYKYFPFIRKQSASEKSNTFVAYILCGRIQKTWILSTSYVLKSLFLDRKPVLYLTYDIWALIPSFQQLHELVLFSDGYLAAGYLFK